MTRSLATAALAAALAAVSGQTSAGGRVPWQRRAVRDVEIPHRLAHARVRPWMWPPEPLSPGPVDRRAFLSALSEICPPLPPDRLEALADSILAESSRYAIDPFLLAALVHLRSGCLPSPGDERAGFGLTRLPVSTHAPHVRGGEYRYFVRSASGWERRALAMPLFPFNQWRAADLAPSIHFSAAILRVFADQCPDLDTALPQAPHRHFASHFFFGDRVLDSEPEDLLLTERRRLLEHYHGTWPVAVSSFLGVAIVSPLDGVPRLVLDDFGNRRGKKTGPGHAGVDIDAVTGEPVRAIADGRVVFAGADLPGGAASRTLTHDEAAAFSPDRFGPGGLYVCVNHGAFKSCYMHLDSLAVAERDEVRAGQAIGTAGRTGTRVAGTHLHLELRVGTERVDPAVPLADALVDPSRLAGP